MNKSIKLLFVFAIFLLFSISLISEDADAWSLFGWLKEKFFKKNVQTVQAQLGKNILIEQKIYVRGLGK